MSSERRSEALERIATYRIQFRDGMTFDKAIGILPYLQELGVSHLYASPVFAATQGSTHGYDVTDYNLIDPALGGREGFDRLSAALQKAGMGLMLDIVPNHMAASLENPWWHEVVQFGPNAPHANHFDIDWSRRLTLPVLGQPFDAAVAGGELVLNRSAAGLVLCYFENAIPLNPGTYALLAEAAPEIESLKEAVAVAGDDRPPAEFHAAIAKVLEEGCEELDPVLSRLSRDAELLVRLHDAQSWRLSHWTEARRDLSYRRFFEVTGLVGTRVEDEEVFDDVHRLTLELVHSGQVDALRVDHVDGLSDPATYLRRLREKAGEHVWLVVEKILEPGEALRPEWPIDGTTGYEFIAAMSDLMIPVEGAAELEAAYAALSSAPEVAGRRDTAKRRVVSHNFEGELSRLGQLAETEIAQQRAAGIKVAGLPADAGAAGGSEEGGSAPHAAHLAPALTEAIRELIVALPVYRTYGDASGFGAEDRSLLRLAASRAREATDVRALAAALDALAAPEALELRARFQQLSGPAMAKAVEDTLFYRHNALLAANEVGCDPVHPPARVDQVHAELARRAVTQPGGLTGTSTHDTKRGEDARARLYTLADAPRDWIGAVSRWREINAAWARGTPGEAGIGTEETLGAELLAQRGPGAALEWAIYQALAGIWPTGETQPGPADLKAMETRFQDYLVKSLREAKLQTSWTRQDTDFEEAVCDFGAHLLDPANSVFREDFHGALRPYDRAGRINSLVQTLVKMTAPGVPDIYQGSEVGDFSMVDPDNRRTVDFAAVADRMARACDAVADPLQADLADAKLRVLAVSLRERRKAPALFSRGDYRPLPVIGPGAANLFAYARTLDGDCAVTVVPLRPLSRGQSSWEGSALLLPQLPESAGERRYRHVLGGGPEAPPLAAGRQEVSIAEILKAEPVGLLCLGD